MLLDVFPSKNSLADVHKHILIPATYALRDVESVGFPIDKSMLSELETGYQSKLQSLEDSIRSFPEVLSIERRISKKFNLNSYDQVRDLLFAELGLSTEGIELTDGGKFSTGKGSINRLKGSHDIVDMIHEHRKYATLYKMFVKPLPKHLCLDGRVHCSYKIHGTVTGRLACAEPNLQQIPKNIDPDEVGFDFDDSLNLKNLYVASGKDYVIMQADYSQMELRVLAEYSQDPVMMKIFQDGLDIHIATGQAMADIAEPGVQVDKKSKWRKAAKAINFGIVYGKGDDSLAVDLGVDVVTAQGFKANYFRSMPNVEAWLKMVERYVQEHKYVTTMFGNARRLLSVDSPQKSTRNEAIRQAVNMPIQGTASHYTVSAIINLVAMFKQFKLKSSLIATVHDSILINVHRKELRVVADMVRTVMSNPNNPLIYWKAAVPFEVDIEVGDRWSTLEAYQS